MKDFLICVIYCFIVDRVYSELMHHSHFLNHSDTQNLKLCRTGEHVNGKWIYRPDLNFTRKSFSCCGEAKGEFLKNKEECGEVGYDIQHLYYGSKTLLSLVGGSGCWCDIIYGYKSINSREMYEWVPNDCQILSFNGSQFCELLGKRKMLLIGDSTMQQTAATLMSMVVSYGGTCADQIAFGRSDQLFFSTKGHLNMYQFVNLVKPEICIINSGPHNHDMGDMFSVLESLKNGWGQLHSPETKYYWKTNNPGHVGCNNGMLKDNTDGPKPYVPGPAGQDQFQWNLHPAFDEMARNYSKILKISGVIDMSPLYLRSDSHWDCLHYCLPGPLNLFSNLVLNMLVTGEM